MADLMRPVPFRELIKRIFAEYRVAGTIFSIPKSNFYKKQNTTCVEVFGEKCDTPVGPAAGPHTQLAQNIITSYLTGGRFFELKTVQILDQLEVSKPCIAPDDECFNCEWSSEYTLEKAYAEYAKAWIILYLLEELFELGCTAQRSFLFNMSVGYNLEGIKEPRVDEFIVKMMDSKGNSVFKGYLKELEEIIASGEFIQDTDLKNNLGNVKNLSEKIDPVLCRGITLSTMHGCPPHEIEAICKYMLTEKKLNTFVKLNPTLLGFSQVREILNKTGFTDIELKEDDFKHDLQYADAVPMLQRLLDIAQGQNLKFGVKMTNTLSSVNNRGILPDDSMYMSGRALYPISINVARKLANEFKGELPISYSGGANSFNIDQIFAVGIQPITMVTDILKPGGYLRFKDAVKVADNTKGRSDGKIDLEGINTLADKSLSADYTQKKWRGKDKISTGRELPLFDCYIAPCVVACPVKQDIPEYIKLVGEGRYKEAVEVIYDKNALPAITGHICDHQCQFNCTRLDYEGTVQIRKIKKIALENGFADYKASWKKPLLNQKIEIAVVGAGPAGLGAAYFLSKEGFRVTVMDKAPNAGGVVQNIIPQFRIPQEIIDQDIDFIKEHGVKFEFGTDPNFTISGLRDKGYKYIVLGIGAEGGAPLRIDGGFGSIFQALDFLGRFHKDPDSLEIGKRVAVVGAGNTAMDACRAALRIPGVEEVEVIYRRTEVEMPAFREEYEEAVQDGIKFNFLLNPAGVDPAGNMIATVMELGKPDESGRRKAIPTAKTVEKQFDTIITAIGEKTDLEILKNAGLQTGTSWVVTNNSLETEVENVYLLGDANGPNSIINAVGDARKVTASICEKENPAWVRTDATAKYKTSFDHEAIILKKGELRRASSSQDSDELSGVIESKRCMECSYICNKCVDVCPNRANIALSTNKDIRGWNNPFQIVHLDAYCNECGNCAQFCPHNGRPYVDKWTVFSREDDFINSKNSGFWQQSEDRGKLRLNGVVSAYNIIKGKAFCENRELNSDPALWMINLINDKYSYLLGPVDE